MLDSHLPGWDYADAYEVAVDASGVQAQDVARVVLKPTRAGRVVLGVRDLAMRPFRVAPVAGASPDDGSLFAVLHDDPSLVVLGLDDLHLDFRILLQVEPGAVRCTTAVRRHSRLGRLYFAFVGPFHRRLVPHLLARARGDRVGSVRGRSPWPFASNGPRPA